MAPSRAALGRGAHRLSGHIAVIAVLLSSAVVATAQNPEAPPADARLTLNLGFSPDPQEIILLAGGPTRLQRTDTNGGVFRGRIDEARPDIVLQYQGEGLLSLYVWVESQADTSLLIHAPDGTWYASNNYPLRNTTANLNPGVSIPRAQSGAYAIWVGTVEEAPAEARLSVSELGLFLDRR